MNDEEKKRQKRGGKGVVKTKKKTPKEKRICLVTAPRGKKKFVTVVSGLSTFGKTYAMIFAGIFNLAGRKSVALTNCFHSTLQI